MTLRALPLLLAAALAGCTGVTDPDDHDHENELITTVELTFVPTTGDALDFVWADLELDGSALVDDILLAPDTDYSLEIAFLNEAGDESEDITAEVEEESDEHQVFLLGSAVEGPATGASTTALFTHAYADEDGNGDPVGLVNDVQTRAAGDAQTLRVVLQHLPAEDGVVVKESDLAEQVAASGIGALPGESDVDVEFAVSLE